VLVINRDEHFLTFCDTIGRPNLPDDPRFTNWPLRTLNRTALQAEITAALASDSAASWEDRMKKAGLAAARVASLRDALERPQMAYRDMLLKLDGTEGLEQAITVLNAPFKYEEDPCGTTRPPPGCGQHTDEVLAEAGYSPAELTVLRESSVMWELHPRQKGGGPGPPVLPGTDLRGTLTNDRHTL